MRNLSSVSHNLHARLLRVRKVDLWMLEFKNTVLFQRLVGIFDTADMKLWYKMVDHGHPGESRACSMRHWPYIVGTPVFTASPMSIFKNAPEASFLELHRRQNTSGHGTTKRRGL